MGERCVIVCLDCSPGDSPVPIPFRSYKERAFWASGHTARTGHEAWFLMDGFPGMAEVKRELAIADTVEKWIGER